MSVPNDSHMITLSQYEAPIRLMMSGNAQWLCFLPPPSSIPPILVHLVVHLCRCRCSTSFPKEAGSLDQVDSFSHRVSLQETQRDGRPPTRDCPVPNFARPPLVPKIFRPFGSGSGLQQSNRQQAIPISAGLEGPGCPRLRHGYSKLPAMPAMTMRSHRRGDACPVEHGVVIQQLMLRDAVEI